MWIAAALLTALTARADPPFEVGMQAYRVGDFPAAADHWRPLAEQGDARSQYYLGTLHAFGRGVPRNDADASRWFALAAAQGHTMAQYSVGPMTGDNLLESEWNQLAARRGDTIARYNLGFMYDEGRGVPADRVQAHLWFNLAATGGFEPAVVGREYCENRMSRWQIYRARRLARRWGRVDTSAAAE